jgi:hypothetical protein
LELKKISDPVTLEDEVKMCDTSGFSFETASGLSNKNFSTMVRHLDSVVWNSTTVVPLNNLK